MRFERLRIHGIAPFRADVDLDISAINGQLIAFVGENGKGKSTALELLPGALHRECPTRGSLVDMALARDSFVEVTVCNGQRYTARQMVDCVSGKGEAVITDASGQNVLGESTSVRAASAWVKSHFVAPEVLYCSSFGVQRQQGMLDMRASERKAVLARALGVERYERMAELARERARAAKAEIDKLRARLGDLPKVDVEAAVRRVEDAQKRVLAEAEAVRVARLAHERAVAAAGDARRQAELLEQRQDAGRRLRAAERQLSDVQERIANNRSLVSSGAEIRAAAARVEALAAEVESLAESHRVARTHALECVTAWKAAEADVERVQRALAKAEERIGQLGHRLRDRVQVEEAQDRLASLAARQQEAEAQLQVLEPRVADLEQLQLSGKDQRISGLRSGLAAIVAADERDDVGMVAGPWASSALEADDALATAAQQAPAELARVRADLSNLRAVLRAVETAQREAHALAARKGEVEQALADMARAEQERTELSEQLHIAIAKRSQAVEARNAAHVQEQNQERRLAALGVERENAAKAAVLLGRLEQAEARIEELQAQLPAIAEQIELAKAELSKLPVIDAVKPVDVAAHERAIATAESVERAARDQAAAERLAVERARETNARREAIEREVATWEAEHSDWTRLSQDLGKDGMQAMEIDAALPELNTIANDLLHSCLSSRYTVELRTDRLTADGKRTVEDLEIRAVDTEQGYDGPAERYSGGQQVMLGEAVSLAMTVVSCRHLGVDRPTLVRDESASALDAKNARAYVAMLRRAAAHINADKILLVTHSKEVQEMADARVLFEDGTVRVA